MYVYIYIYTYIHTYIHVYTYVYTFGAPRVRRGPPAAAARRRPVAALAGPSFYISFFFVRGAGRQPFRSRVSGI